MKTKYFLYARKSTEDEERQVMSIEAQLGDAVPVVVELGDVALGTYLVLGGGILGIISAILPREDYY